MIGNGEDSGVEFKHDDVTNHDLAKELVALLNLDGGTVLLGDRGRRLDRGDQAGEPGRVGCGTLPSQD